GYEYGSFHFLEPSFLHNYTDSTIITKQTTELINSALFNFFNFLSLFGFDVVEFYIGKLLQYKTRKGSG
ncbi:hypothetical protein ABNF65_24705, partial [Paenibacillus larvae]